MKGEIYMIWYVMGEKKTLLATNTNLFHTFCKMPCLTEVMKVAILTFTVLVMIHMHVSRSFQRGNELCRIHREILRKANYRNTRHHPH